MQYSAAIVALFAALTVVEGGSLIGGLLGGKRSISARQLETLWLRDATAMDANTKDVANKLVTCMKTANEVIVVTEQKTPFTYNLAAADGSWPTECHIAAESYIKEAKEIDGKLAAVPNGSYDLTVKPAQDAAFKKLVQITNAPAPAAGAAKAAPAPAKAN